MQMENVWLALALTFFAGMATGLGGIIAFFARRTNYRFLSVSTAFAAGVMLYISFVEILMKGAEALEGVYGAYWGNWINAACFFAGMALIGIIDGLVPSAENPHETPTREEMDVLEDPDPTASVPDTGSMASPDTPIRPGAHPHGVEQRKLMRTGFLTALAIAIHNFPEGLVTFLAALHDPATGIAIAVAIALHNIPEGISVSVPIYYATGSRRKALLYSVLSGLAEPVGALIALAALHYFVVDEAGVVPAQIMGMLFALVAGIMVYISLDQLLPTSRTFGKGHDSILGMTIGMAVMALSLLLMG